MISKIMKTSRFIEASKTLDYVIPAITLGSYSRRCNNNGYLYFPEYEGKIHIGIDKGANDVACFCGQHHKQKDRKWQSPPVDEAPDITCKLCLRTMRNIIGNNPEKAHKALIKALDQRVEDTKYHVSKRRTSDTASPSTPSPPEAFPRQLGAAVVDVFPRVLPTGLILFACFKATYIPKFGMLQGSGIIHSLTLDRDNKSIPVCGEKAGSDSSWVIVKHLEDAENITCPTCVAIQRKRQVESEPKRDKSLALRKSLIAAEHARLDRFYKEYHSVVDYVSANKADAPEKWKEISEEFVRALNNLQILESGILVVKQ